MAGEEKVKDREAVESYVKSLKLDQPVSPDEFRAALRGTVGDRGLMVYLIWKLLRQRYPQVDAEGLLRDACREFGEFKAKKFGQVSTAADWLRKLSSRAGALAWDQEFVELNDDRAVKVFNYCPHVAAARAAGANEQEAARLCRDIMMAADFGTISPFPHLELSFPGKTYGEGGKCRMTIVKKRQ